MLARSDSSSSRVEAMAAWKRSISSISRLRGTT